MKRLKYLATLIAGIIVGIAIILSWGRGLTPDADVVAIQEKRELEFSDLFFRGAIAYSVSPDSSRPVDEPFTGRGVHFYESGQIKLSGEFVNGKPDGEWELWHDKQTLWVSSSLSGDGFFPQRDGCELMVDAEGEVCLENFSNLSRNAYTRWHENGQLQSEGTYQNGELEGLQRTWHENGQLQAEATYQNNELEGLQRIWHENGQLQLEGTNQNGELEGLQRMWHDNGQLQWEGTYQNNEVEGLVRMWHENGQLSSEGTAQNGEQEGLQRIWHENGQLQAEATYQNGELEGLVRSWDENGQLEGESTYQNGELIE